MVVLDQPVHIFMVVYTKREMENQGNLNLFSATKSQRRKAALRLCDLCVFASSWQYFIFSLYSSKTPFMNYRLLMMLIAASAILSCNNSTETKMAT